MRGPKNGGPRWPLYLTLAALSLLFLLPLYVALVTSFKPMDEIRAGGIFLLPENWTIAPWLKAWGGACIGTNCTGLSGYFTNSVLMAVPAVFFSVMLGAFNGYCLAKWRFPGSEWVFGALILGSFIPFQTILLPMAQTLSKAGLFGSLTGLALVHIIYGLTITTMLFRNFYVSMPDELVRAARMDGAGLFRSFLSIFLPLSPPMIVVAVILQFTAIWNDFLFGLVFAGTGDTPLTVALNNLVNTTFGVKEYNMNMAAAMLTALPTILVYIFSGRFFVRGLTSGAVKG